MASLDFSDILTDPDLADTIAVTSITRAIGTNGRATDTAATPVPGIIAVVVPVAQKLILQSDGALRDGAISIFSVYALSGGVKTDDSGSRQPDIIGWHGRDYVVASVEDFTAFGAGWVHAIANLSQINPTA